MYKTRKKNDLVLTSAYITSVLLPIYYLYIIIANTTMLAYEKVNTKCTVYDKYRYTNNGTEIIVNYDNPNYKILYSDYDNFDSIYMSINNCVPKHCTMTYVGFMLPQRDNYETSCFKKGL